MELMVPGERGSAKLRPGGDNRSYLQWGGSLAEKQGLELGNFVSDRLGA